MPVMETDVYNWMKMNPFFQHLGFELVSYENHEILMKLKIKQELLNTNKTLHGGVHASMLDSIQSTFLRGLYHCQVSAVNLDVHYFAPLSEGKLFARAKPLQQGYKMAVMEAEIRDVDNQIIAKGTGVYKIIRK